MYQCCTEFGFFPTSNYVQKIFSDKFLTDFFIQYCTDIFGRKYDASFLDDVVERTNIKYGGLNIQATNVVFVHGSEDPWHSLGITTAKNNGTVAIFIKGKNNRY